jgi:bacillithiol biosynthesis cysteine-adding enzyme BshC
MIVDRISHLNHSLLVGEYLNNPSSLIDFFPLPPDQRDSFIKRAKEIQSQYSIDRNAIVKDLLEYNLGLGCGSETISNIEKLRKQDTYAIVTGQQAGVFTGPLYTIYKIITAILLAEHITETMHIHCVPVFWVASEDHDFDEIKRILLFGVDNQINTIELESHDFSKVSVGYLPVTDSIYTMIDDLEKMTPDGQSKGKYLKLLKETAASSDSIANWFSRLVSILFQSNGLICTDPMSHAQRELSAPIFTQAVQLGDMIQSVLTERTQKLRQAGYDEQITVTENSLTLFRSDQNARELIHKDELNQFYSDNMTKSIPMHELIESIYGEPHLFSPNVVLRPIVQDHLFPTLAYVAGPGEVAYYSQLKDVYPLFKKSMPVIYPRLSATLIENQVQKEFTSLGFTVSDFLKKHQQILTDYLANSEPFPIDQRFDSVKSDIASIYEALMPDLHSLHPNLVQLIEGNLGRIHFQVDYLRKKSKQRHRKNEKEYIDRFRSLADHIMPHEHLQERVYNIFPYLFSYDDQVLKAISQSWKISDFRHSIIQLGDDND